VSDAETRSEADEARVLTARIVQIVETLLGCSSRWNGVIRLETDVLHAGVASPEGSIGISRFVWDHPVYRWRTLLHEVLHTFTPDFTRSDYARMPGWEEGVVEQLQRLLRSRVFDAMQIALPDDAFADIEREHRYNCYIDALEAVRQVTGEERETFYRRLLVTPMMDRFDLLSGEAETLPEHQRTTYRVRLQLAHGKLTRRISGI